ncbi:MAG: hypothetical protein RLZZ123_2427 [Pseudomonadota bacterium]
MRRAHPPARGAVLLLALMLTALVAALVSTALWRQSGQIWIESAERERQQAQWLLTGATDWARLILREDARVAGSSDHLSEPWAVPLQESRISTFLSSQPNLSEYTADSPLNDQVWLSGAITDAQGKFNLTNLFNNNKPDAAALNQLQRLFELLGLSSDLTKLLMQNLALTRDPSPSLLPPRTIDDLAAWGFGPEAIERLRPHLVILPEPSPVNVNTASPEVLAATVPGLSLGQAQRVAQNRLRSPMTDVKMASSVFGSNWNTATHSISSQFFEISGRFRMSTVTLAQTALVKRDKGNVNYLWVLPSTMTPRP